MQIEEILLFYERETMSVKVRNHNGMYEIIVRGITLCVIQMQIRVKVHKIFELLAE